jgi:hypothetical protein
MRISQVRSTHASSNRCVLKLVKSSTSVRWLPLCRRSTATVPERLSLTNLPCGGSPRTTVAARAAASPPLKWHASKRHWLVAAGAARQKRSFTLKCGRHVLPASTTLSVAKLRARPSEKKWPKSVRVASAWPRCDGESLVLRRLPRKRPDLLHSMHRQGTWAA